MAETNSQSRRKAFLFPLKVLQVIDKKYLSPKGIGNYNQIYDKKSQNSVSPIFCMYTALCCLRYSSRGIANIMHCPIMEDRTSSNKV